MSKLEKKFTDHYLVDNFNEILTYMRIDMLEKLNSFEKCLLIDVAVNKSNSE